MTVFCILEKWCFMLVFTPPPSVKELTDSIFVLLPQFNVATHLNVPLSAASIEKYETSDWSRTYHWLCITLLTLFPGFPYPQFSLPWALFSPFLMNHNSSCANPALASHNHHLKLFSLSLCEKCVL